MIETFLLAASASNQCRPLVSLIEYCTSDGADIDTQTPDRRITLHVMDNASVRWLEVSRAWFELSTRSPAVAEGPRDAGVPVEILSAAQM